MERFDADKANAERKALVERMRKTREQILNDQAANAKRDEKALQKEREWKRE